MAARKRKTSPDRPERSAAQAASETMEPVVRMAWQQMRAAIESGMDSGKMEAVVGPEHVAALRAVMANDDVALSLFRAGFNSCQSMMRQAAEMASAMIPHDCDIPGHNHGPAAQSRIGRA
jgi:hypothetical protein